MKYPLLTEMLEMMGAGNFGSEYSSVKLSDDEYVWPDNAASLELKASELTTEEQYCLVAGEHTEQEEITARYKAEELSEFLNEVFDGDLYYNFYKKD